MSTCSFFALGCLTGTSDVTCPNLNSWMEPEYSLPPSTYLLMLKSWRVLDHNFPHVISYQCLLMLLCQPLHCLSSPSSVLPPKPKPCFLFPHAFLPPPTPLPRNCWRCVNVGQFMAFLFFPKPALWIKYQTLPISLPALCGGLLPSLEPVLLSPLLTRIQ